MTNGTIVTFKQCQPDRLCFTCPGVCFNTKLYKPDAYYGKLIKTDYSDFHGHNHLFIEMCNGETAIIDECFAKTKSTEFRVERMLAI